MLNELKILNGELSLKFDPLNTVYTVNLDNDDDLLLFDYKIAENDNISIFGNELDYGFNEVVVTVYNDSKSTSYYLEVYKESNKKVLASDNSYSDVKVSKMEMPSYTVPAISTICFLTILFLFVLLFKKNKNY